MNETYESYLAAVRALPQPKAPNPHCGLCGTSFWGLEQPARHVCGHRVHPACQARYLGSESCGYCLDELLQARTEATPCGR